MKAREQKRREAEERAASLATLVLEDRLYMISKRPGQSRREVNRLLGIKEKKHGKR